MKINNKVRDMESSIKNFFKTWIVIVFVQFFSAGAVHAAKQDNILLTIDEVKSLVDQGGVTLVDSRPLIEYKKSHIKGAVSMPVDETFTKSGRSDLVASIIEMRDLMYIAGITQDSKVVVYGDKSFLGISRLFWVLETFGVKDVAIMNSFLTEWAKRGYSIESGEQAVQSSTVYPTLNEDKLATMLMVFSSIKKEDESLIDARAEVEYNGEQSMTGVHGHIPTAINIPWYRNLTSDYTQFKPLSELKEIYKGLDMKKMNTVYCNKGKESATNYVALRLLGANVRAYDGSWYEWSLQEGLPISKGK
jgi:thiosulfate/3-mercaptopyruvate sulfurtransferase